jgi:hypothetical protein
MDSSSRRRLDGDHLSRHVRRQTKAVDRGTVKEEQGDDQERDRRARQVQEVDHEREAPHGWQEAHVQALGHVRRSRPQQLLHRHAPEEDEVEVPREEEREIKEEEEEEEEEELNKYIS